MVLHCRRRLHNCCRLTLSRLGQPTKLILTLIISPATQAGGVMSGRPPPRQYVRLVGVAYVLNVKL